MLSVICIALLLAFVTSTPLDDYVKKDDPNYFWFDTGLKIHGRNKDHSVNYIGYVLNMTSQRWLTDADTTRSLWWHYLVVIVPSNYNKETSRNGTLWITDGNNDNPEEVPTRFNYNMILASEFAMGLGVITGCLFQIPNQHMVFTEDPLQKRRAEDSIIAYTWARFLDKPDEPEWLVRFPMVKASVRAMDTISAFAKEKLHLPRIDYYSVSGASKRGWTTWLVGAVDSRVQALVPIVLDAINFVAVEKHHWRSYGGWAYALQDYYDSNITKRYDDPNMVLLQQAEDPFFYASRLTMPKLIINGVGDEFQQPDDTHYWWSSMPEPKNFLIMPNTDHSTIAGAFQEVPAIITFLKYVLTKSTLPSATWTISPETGDITAKLVSSASTGAQGFPMPPLRNATMWFATTCTKGATGKRRDFRYSSLDNPCECGFLSDGTCINREAFGWRSRTLVPLADGTFVAHMDAPTDGSWGAFFIDFTFESPKQPRSDGLQNWPYDEPGNFDFTTEVSVWPNTFPYDECYGDGCYGTLL